MQKLIRKTIVPLLIILGIFFSNGCASSPTFSDINIKAHWIKTGEIAPFDGVLLSDYTYYKLREKIIEQNGTN